MITKESHQSLREKVEFQVEGEHHLDQSMEINDPLPDLAAIVSVAYAQRSRLQYPVLPIRLMSGWHRNNRIPVKWMYGVEIYGHLNGQH